MGLARETGYEDREWKEPKYSQVGGTSVNTIKHNGIRILETYSRITNSLKGKSESLQQRKIVKCLSGKMVIRLI